MNGPLVSEKHFCIEYLLILHQHIYHIIYIHTLNYQVVIKLELGMYSIDVFVYSLIVRI